jgi:hypothetical protein
MPHSLRLFAGVLAVALPLGLIGCGSSTDSGSGGSSAGLAVANKYDCADCHSPTGKNTDLSGSKKDLKAQYNFTAYGANLTPDKATGLGTWTDDQIGDAIVKGKRNDNTALCRVMPFFGPTASCNQSEQSCEGPMSSEELTEIVAYLKSLKAVSNAVPKSPCTP